MELPERSVFKRKRNERMIRFCKFIIVVYVSDKNSDEEISTTAFIVYSRYNKENIGRI